MEIETGAQLKNGVYMKRYTLENQAGMKITVSDFGATLLEVWVQDIRGRLQDVVLGYQQLADYEQNNHAYFGATIGRHANRMAKAQFQIEDTLYKVEANEHETSLHSGSNGYHLRSWTMEFYDETKNRLTFRLDSPDMDQGFPGDLIMRTHYQLTEANEIILTYEGQSTKTTLFNPTNHSYFNLNGRMDTSIVEHQLELQSSFYTPIDASSIPLGMIRSVEKTPFDFRKKKTIGKKLNVACQQLNQTNGYDHNFIIDKQTDYFATLIGDISAIKMRVATDLPGVQLYTGNFIDGVQGKDGLVYEAYAGVCLETQFFPDAINQKAFEKPWLKPAETVCYETVYAFSVALPD